MAQDDVVIDPWGSAQSTDYDRIIEQFGLSSMDNITMEHPSRLHRRGIVFAHRDLDQVLDAQRKGDPFGVLTGLMPSGQMHLGHSMVIDQVKWFQQQGGDVTIAVAFYLGHFHSGGRCYPSCVADDDDSKNIKLAMGCLIIFIAILFLKNWRYEGKRNIFTTGVVAVATGGATGAFGIPGGPIAVMYYLSARIEPTEQRANIILTGFLNTLIFLGGFIFHGIYKTVSIIDSSLLIPGFIIGVTFGQYLFKVMPSDWFSKATSIMLLVIGLVTIIV